MLLSIVVLVEVKPGLAIKRRTSELVANGNLETMAYNPDKLRADEKLSRLLNP